MWGAHHMEKWKIMEANVCSLWKIGTNWELVRNTYYKCSFFLYHLIGFEMKYLILEKNLVKYLYP